MEGGGCDVAEMPRVSLFSNKVPGVIVSGGGARQVQNDLLQALPLGFRHPKELKPKRLTTDPLHGRCLNHQRPFQARCINTEFRREACGSGCGADSFVYPWYSALFLITPYIVR
jgi:hypothetical protein